MAGILTHLIIAMEIQKLLPVGTIIDEGLFYLGSVAPDAIHAREGFVRADKKHTHLRDDIMDKDFGLEENLNLFHERVADFILKNINRKDGLLDMYRGYVVHILTDELFMLSIRQEFCSTMELIGIVQSDKGFYFNILTDMNRNDILLSKNYEGTDEIKIKVEQGKSCRVEGFLSEEEICNSKNWLIHQYFCEEHELLEPVYISYDRMLEFIRMAAGDIVKRLSKGGSLPRMF